MIEKSTNESRARRVQAARDFVENWEKWSKELGVEAQLAVEAKTQIQKLVKKEIDKVWDEAMKSKAQKEIKKQVDKMLRPANVKKGLVKRFENRIEKIIENIKDYDPYY